MIRHRLAVASLAALALSFGAGPATAITPAKARASAQVRAQEVRFKTLAARYIATLARLSPTEATTLGDHRYDALLPDVSTRGRAARDGEWRMLLGQLHAIPRAHLSREAQVDWLLLENDLQYRLWSNANEQEWAWDPQYYSGIASGALYGLAARDFAPWDVRLKAATARMEAIPALLAESRRQLVPARVPKIHAETVAKRNSGIMDIATDMLAPHADALKGADRARFDRALAGLKAAVAENQTWLDHTLVPQARGDFRLGAAKYDAKMKFALMSDMTRGDLKARALKAKADCRDEMYVLSQQVLAGRAGAPTLPDHPTAAQQQAAIEAALALTYAKRPPRDGLMDAARASLAQATKFVRDRNLVGVPETPVKIIEMPRAQWGYAVAYDDAPGALETDQPNFFAIAPIPPEWTDQQATSFLSEYNAYMVQDLAIHEAMPGHYLQLAHANRSPDVLRAVLGSGPFVEGWAVYGEGMMKDAGYMDGDPLFKLTVLKMRLRSITNTLLDIGIQTEGMTRDQAMTLMTDGAFQQEREAAGKWVRASLSSVQLLSYFTGFSEHTALRQEAMKREGAAFDLRNHNDAVIAHGSPPVKFVRELMFGLPIR